MNRVISRPARAVLPALLALILALMPDRVNGVLVVWTAVLTARALSLCAGGALRRAAGAMTSDARLRGNFLTALAMSAVGGALLTGMGMTEAEGMLFDMNSALAGAIICASQLCCDRMYATRDSLSPWLYDVLIALLAAAAIVITDGVGVMLPLMCLPALLVGLGVLFGLRRGKEIKPGFRVLAAAPAALAKGWFFPMAITLGALAHAGEIRLSVVVLVCCAVMEMLEPVFRRSEAESAGASAAMCAMAVAALIVTLAFPKALQGIPSPDSAAIYTDAMLCAVLAASFGIILTGVALNLRRAGMLIALLAAAVIMLLPRVSNVDTSMYQNWTMAAAAVALAALMIPDLREVYVRGRARKISTGKRKKNM